MILHVKSLCNFLRQENKMWHKEMINTLCKHEDEKFIRLMTTRCWNMAKLLRDNARL